MSIRELPPRLRSAANFHTYKKHHHFSFTYSIIKFKKDKGCPKMRLYNTDFILSHNFPIPTSLHRFTAQLKGLQNY